MGTTQRQLSEQAMRTQFKGGDLDLGHEIVNTEDVLKASLDVIGLALVEPTAEQ